MPPTQKPMRYAHSEGHTDVCYSEDGKYIITCGNDGELRVWAGIEDDDNQTLCVAEEKANSVAHKGDRMFVGTDDNWVQAYTFLGHKRDGVITRFTAPVTDITVSSSGRILVSSSCDMEIHVTELKESKPDAILIGHEAPVIGVSVDPKEQFVVSSSCDGTVRVWDIELRDSVKTWNCVPKCNSFFLAPVLARASWQPTDRNYLAVPQNKEVQLYERGTWTEVVALSSSSCSQPFSLTAFSPCGNYLAAVAADKICIWDVNHHTQVNCFSHERGQKVCALVWNPTVQGELAYCDILGQLGTIENVLPEVGSGAPLAPVTSHNKMDSDSLDGLKDLDANDFHLDDDDDDDDDNGISLDKIKNELSMNRGGGGGGGADDDDDDKTTAGGEDDARSSISGHTTRVGLKVNTQPSFQPSSTPESLQHRFMVWNSVGIIRCINNHEENSIDVRFHDTSVHHALHLNNILGHSVAALSEQAVVLSSPALDDAPSKVVCIALNSWDGTREWVTSFPEGESSLGVATGKDWLAVATDRQNLRIFSLAGTQRQVITIPGPLVCLAGFKEKLLVVFHGGVGLPDEQCLWYQLLTVTQEGPVYSSPSQPLPISPGATLKWAGFSDERSPCTLDSLDILRLLPIRTHTWMPVCDTKDHAKGKSDHFFVVGVSECYQNVRAVLCRGAYYPQTAPLPVVSELPLQLPFCEMDTEKSKLEENLWRSQLTLATMKAVIDNSMDDNDLLMAEKYRDEAEKHIKESLIKLFALSTRGGLEMRAIELCHLMPSAQVTELAAKYAVKIGRSLLADRVSNVVSSKREKEEAKRFSFRAPSPDLFASQSQTRISTNCGPDKADCDDVHQEFDKENESEGENLLLAAKRKRAALEAESVEIKPAVLLQSQKRLNPFKKAASQNAETRGLDRLSSPYSSPQELKKKYASPIQGKSSALGGFSSKPQAKQMTLFGKKLEPKEQGDKSKAEDSKKPLPFMTWYSQEKAALQEEFPDLDSADLTKLGMKRYKEVNASKKQVVTDPQSDKTSDAGASPEAKKQKMDGCLAGGAEEEEEEEAAALLAAAAEAMETEGSSEESTKRDSVEQKAEKSGISKLKAFAFSSNKVG